MLRKLSYRAPLVLALVLGLHSSLKAQGPTSDDPLLPLALWSDREDLRQLHTEATDLFNQAAKSSQSIAERVDAGRIKQVKLTEVGKLHVTNLQLQRRARKLAMWGEPSGLDFLNRSSVIDNQLHKVVETLRPNYTEALGKGKQTLAGKFKKNKKNLELVANLLKKKKFVEAEAKLLPMVDDMELIGVWFPAAIDRIDSLAPFDSAVVELDHDFNPVRQAEALEAIAAERAKRLPDFDGLLTAVAAATSSIAATGQAEVDGKKLSGPELFSLFADRWRQAQADMLYCRALDWATTTAPGGNVGPGAAALPKLMAEHEKFSPAMAAALAGIVEADAARAVDPEATQLLAEYCRAAAPVVLSGDWPPLTSAVEAALAKLATKSPAGLAYAAATDDLLRWRAKVAEAEARAVRKPFGDVSGEAVSSPIYRDQLPIVARTAGEGLVGKKVKWTNLVASERGQPAVGRYQNASFATSTPIDFSALGKRMKYDLMLAKPTPPLTLAAAMAWESLRRGDLAEVGGPVTQVELEGLIPLYARPRPETAGLVRLGPPQVEVDNARDPLRHIRYRVQLTPEWARNKYGFVNLEPQK